MRDTGADNRQLLEWPAEHQFYLTLDLECDYGTALTENTFGALDQVDRLVTSLERHDTPLTCFVQTQVLDEHPSAVERLQDADVEVTFHPHSHTHTPREATSIRDEIERSSERYAEYFGQEPVGYRLPNGNVRQADYRHLSAQGYDFDASVFPSWRPNHFNNSRAPTVPHYLPDHEILEVPFTVYSSLVRIPTALSYCHLLGRPFTGLLARAPPTAVVFNIHMHDLVNPPAYEKLSPFYKAVYARNADGFGTLNSLLQRFTERGYDFCTIDETVRALSA